MRLEIESTNEIGDLIELEQKLPTAKAETAIGRLLEMFSDD